MRRWLPVLVPALAILCLSAAPARAQYFGKNKVQYESLRWAVLETPHVRLHFYAEEEDLARRMAALAESVCVAYDARFRVRPRGQVPLLLYSAHHLFQQTNATPELLTEATGGLTELIKGRVLVPHNGSWARLGWVTRHELAHWYMLEKLNQVRREHHRAQYSLPPLWFIEGLAEYCSTRGTPTPRACCATPSPAARRCRSPRAGPSPARCSCTRRGSRSSLYLAERFGDARIFDLLENWWRADDFETVFRMTFGEPLETTDEAVVRRRCGGATTRPSPTRAPVKDVAARADRARPLQPRPVRAAQARRRATRTRCASATSPPARTAST